MITIEDTRSNRIQAIFLKGHLRLHSKGLRARGVRAGDLLAKAGAITGKSYERGQYEQAANDLQEYIDAS